MANASFGVNIIPKNNTVTIGNSNSPWTIVSPSMTGTPTAPTAAAGTDNTQVATTAFVKSAVDAARTSVTFTTLGFSIATTDWSSTSPYTYTFTNSIIGDNTTIDVYFDTYDGGDGFPKSTWTRAQNGTGLGIKAAKVSGGVLFTAKAVPTDTITGTIRVIGVAQNNRMVEVTDTTIPISKGGTGAANAAGAKANLGLNNVENKSSATIRSEITQSNINNALNTGVGTAKFYREDGTWAVPPDTTYSTATTSANGLMSSSDKSKLDGIAAGAQVNPGPATTSTAGLMSAADKSKLDGIAAGATANTGTITEIVMNGVSQGTSGSVNLGTVITSHQNISGKADKYNTVLTGSLSISRKSGTHDGTHSVAMGSDAAAGGDYSMAQGKDCIAAGDYSQAFGNGTVATARGSFVFGSYNVIPDGITMWTADTSYAVNDMVVYNGQVRTCTTANSDSTFDESKWGVTDAGGLYTEIVGNGSSTSRKNIRALDTYGNEHLKGTLYVGCNDNSTGGTAVLSKGSTWGALAGASGY